MAKWRLCLEIEGPEEILDGTVEAVKEVAPSGWRVEGGEYTGKPVLLLWVENKGEAKKARAEGFVRVKWDDKGALYVKEAKFRVKELVYSDPEEDPDAEFLDADEDISVIRLLLNYVTG